MEKECNRPKCFSKILPEFKKVLWEEEQPVLLVDDIKNFFSDSTVDVRFFIGVVDAWDKTFPGILGEINSNKLVIRYPDTNEFSEFIFEKDVQIHQMMIQTDKKESLLISWDDPKRNYRGSLVLEKNR